MSILTKSLEIWLEYVVTSEKLNAIDSSATFLIKEQKH